MVCVVGARRWIHHAQLELVPVLVPVGADVQAVVNPSPAMVAGRMLRDVREALERPQRPRLAVLTFDDGPYPVESPALADVLSSLHVPADFFFIGRDAQRQPAIATRLGDRGFEIGNHTLSHPEMTQLGIEGQRSEIAGGASAIEALVSHAPVFFRPPHGNYDADTLRAASDSGEVVALWDVDPGDWRSIPADEIVAAALDQARAPAVILLHNGKDATIEALPRIVAAYRNAGYRFVTLGTLVSSAGLDAINDPMRVRL